MPVDGITRTDAEALFAEQVAPNVVAAATKRSVALATIPTIPMGSSTYRIPILSALPTSAFLTADQAVKPNSEAAWDKKLLTAEELAVIVIISETVIADASIDVVAQVTDLIAQEFGRAVDAAVFFGTGAPATWPAGGLDGVATAAGQIVTSTNDPAVDFNELFATLEEAGYDPTDVYVGRAMKGVLRGQTGAGGVALYNPLDGGITVGSVYGVPLAFPLAWDAAKADALAIADSGVILGLRQDLTIKYLDQATITGFGNLAERDSIAIRATMRLGLQVANPISIDSGTRIYPVAKLVPTAGMATASAQRREARQKAQADARQRAEGGSPEQTEQQRAEQERAATSKKG